MLSTARLGAALRGPFTLPVVVGASICSLVLRRLSGAGLQSYGADGAQYLEHTARLRVLKLWRGTESFFPLGFAADADAAFPPVLHLVTLPIGGALGHSAETAAKTGVLWLVLLAVLVGWIAYQLGASRRASGLAALVVVVTPALHGLATRYYYDLPMTVFLWASAGVLLATLGARLSPLRGGVGTGLLLALAALTKWAALAFGAPILLGVLFLFWQERRSSGRLQSLVVPAVVAVGTTAVVLAAFLAASGPENSLNSMASTAYAGPHGLARLSGRGLAHLAFYPLRLVVSAVSPALAFCVVPPVIAWALGKRQALPLVLCVVAGHTAFLVVGMPALDDRFLVPGLPVLALVVAQGWESLPSRPRRVHGSLSLGVALWVAWDFHGGAQGPLNQEVGLTAPSQDDVPPTHARGLGAASSVEGRGWLRADEQRPHAGVFREVLWAVVARERPTYLGVPGQKILIDPWGDLEWWRYRGLLGQVSESGVGPEVIAICPPPGHGPYEAEEPDLVVNFLAPGALPDLPACLDATRWSLIDVVADPGSDRQAVFFRPYVPPQP